MMSGLLTKTSVSFSSLYPVNRIIFDNMILEYRNVKQTRNETLVTIISILFIVHHRN